MSNTMSDMLDKYDPGLVGGFIGALIAMALGKFVESIYMVHSCKKQVDSLDVLIRSVEPILVRIGGENDNVWSQEIRRGWLSNRFEWDKILPESIKILLEWRTVSTYNVIALLHISKRSTHLILDIKNKMQVALLAVQGAAAERLAQLVVAEGTAERGWEERERVWMQSLEDLDRIWIDRREKSTEVCLGLLDEAVRVRQWRMEESERVWTERLEESTRVWMERPGRLEDLERVWTEKLGRFEELERDRMERLGRLEESERVWMQRVEESARISLEQQQELERVWMERFGRLEVRMEKLGRLEESERVWMQQVEESAKISLERRVGKDLDGAAGSVEGLALALDLLPGTVGSVGRSDPSC